MKHALYLALAASMGLAACASKSPPQRLMALPTPPLPATSTQQGTAPVRWLQIGRVDLPEYWQARALRYRDAQDQIANWDGVVWAERVEVGVTRNLMVELAQRLPQPWQLCSQVCGDADNRPLRLLVALSPMDYRVHEAKLTAWAQTTVLSSTGTILSHQTRPLTSTSTLTDPPAAQVQATASMIGMLADVMALQIQAQVR